MKIKVIALLSALLVTVFVSGCGAEDKIYKKETTYKKEGKLVSRDDNNLVNGTVQTFIDNKLAIETPYDDGVKSGVEKHYNGKGNVVVEVPYSNDKKNGLVKRYFGSGEKKVKATFMYANDALNGSYKTYYNDGDIQLDLIIKDNRFVSGTITQRNGSKVEVEAVVFNDSARAMLNWL